MLTSRDSANDYFRTQGVSLISRSLDVADPTHIAVLYSRRWAKSMYSLIKSQLTSSGSNGLLIAIKIHPWIWNRLVTRSSRTTQRGLDAHSNPGQPLLTIQSHEISALMTGPIIQDQQ